MFNRTFSVAIAIAAVTFLLVPAQPARAAGDWNDSQVKWRAYPDGLAEAKRDGKPACLVFYTDWCPHCASYSGIFHDSAVVELAEKFVMIRVERDANREISSKYAPDGEYIPRTYFLAPSGEMDASITEQRDKYKYFYDTARPVSLLRAMKAALEKHSPASSPTVAPTL